MSSLAEVARRCDDAVSRARAELVAAVRTAAAEGMTQSEIAREIGRSQPEVSRLLRFHATTPRARALRRHRQEVIRLVREAGGSNVRIFGSVATGTDGEDSDVDLVFDLGAPMGLMGLARLERRVSEVIDMPVDLVPEADLRPDLRDRILGQAVPV